MVQGVQGGHRCPISGVTRRKPFSSCTYRLVFCSRVGARGKGRFLGEAGAAGGVAIADGSPFLGTKPSPQQSHQPTPAAGALFQHCTKQALPTRRQEKGSGFSIKTRVTLHQGKPTSPLLPSPGSNPREGGLCTIPMSWHPAVRRDGYPRSLQRKSASRT